MAFKVAEHHIARRGELLPPVDESLMLDYVLGRGGLFARGRRPGLEVCMPVAAPLAPVRGLAPVVTYAQWGFPKVPAGFLALMLAISRHVARAEPREALFHLSFDAADPHEPLTAGHILCDRGWHLEYPDQRREKGRVELVNKGRGTSEERAIIEVHSHHHDKAYFSPEDDEDEGGMSFRVYGVLGTIFSRPALRTRIGLFGHFFLYPAAEFFELPAEITDLQGGQF
ncbi:MAG TPA: Mov34/MPN/PAD-1 family protein [Pyrinomonadaceae bacterium]|jgi:hypothetical protein